MLKDKKVSFAIVLFCVIVGLLFFVKYLQVHDPADIKSVHIAGQDVVVDLAMTPATQAQGLSGRVSLKEDEGMLFIFEKVGHYGFWMKDMNFPIDMIWIDAGLKVIYIAKNADPASYPKDFGPSEDSKYVLEVVSGFSEKNNLQVGDTIEFRY